MSQESQGERSDVAIISYADPILGRLRTHVPPLMFTRATFGFDHHSHVLELARQALIYLRFLEGAFEATPQAVIQGIVLYEASAR